MPSQSLLSWRTNRLPRLNEVEVQCAATAALVPAPDLADENLRGYVMLLSAHFQGFCRDLHTECVQVLASAAPSPMALTIQTQGLANRGLDGGNPRFETIREDFERFALALKAVLAPDAVTKTANERRITHLGHLSHWRNYCAHHKNASPSEGGPLSVATVQGWKDSCHGLAEELDRVMYNRLRAVTGSAPW